VGSVDDTDDCSGNSGLPSWSCARWVHGSHGWRSHVPWDMSAGKDIEAGYITCITRCTRLSTTSERTQSNRCPTVRVENLSVGVENLSVGVENLSVGVENLSVGVLVVLRPLATVNRSM